MEKILVVEDDESIRNLIKLTLEQFQYEVQAFEDAESAWKYLQDDTADVGIFDLMLPGMSGLDLIAKIRKDEQLQDFPVIILTAKDSEIDKVIGLDSGADDYVTKPFGMMELVSRIKAVLRRSKGSQERENPEIQGVHIDVKKHEVTVDGRTVPLTLKEFELLEKLMRNEGIVLTRDQLLTEIWGYDFDGETRTVDVHVRTLRQKLGEAGNLIETVRGVGYRIGDHV